MRKTYELVEEEKKKSRTQRCNIQHRCTERDITFYDARTPEIWRRDRIAPQSLAQVLRIITTLSTMYPVI